MYRQQTGLVSYAGIVVRCGSRDETEKLFGMAHFIEHTAFKGGGKYNARQIIDKIEGVGGEMNAFTTKEETTFYATVPTQYLGRAIDILADITLSPTFPKDEINKERSVIYDEIDSYNDSPSELIFDDFEALIYDTHPLAHSILGSPKTLRWFNTEKAQQFHSEHYQPHKMIMFVGSDLPFDKVLKMIEKTGLSANHNSQFYPHPELVSGSHTPHPELVSGSHTPHPELVSGSHTPRSALVSGSHTPHSELVSGSHTPHPELVSGSHDTNYSYHPSEQAFHKHTHQAHVMLGIPAFSFFDKQRDAMAVLNAIVAGGSMNSRLNLALRERLGLVYQVESQYVPFSDTGYWSVYFASEPHDVGRCLKTIFSELKKLRDKPLSEKTFKAYQRQMKGQLLLAAENTESYILQLSKQMLYFGKVQDISEQTKSIDSLTAEQIWQLSRQMFDFANFSILRYE